MFDIKIDGKSLLLETLKEKKKRLTNYREFFEDYVTPALFKRFDDIFEKEGAVSNFSRWRRLRAATILEKKRKGYRLEILRRTDRLQKAYTRRNSDSQVLIRPQSLTYKNLVPYGAYHETGTSRVPKRTVIARLLAYKEFRNDLKNGMSKYLESD